MAGTIHGLQRKMSAARVPAGCCDLAFQEKRTECMNVHKKRHLLDSGMAWAASFASVSGLWAPYFGSWLQARHLEPPGLS